MGILKKLWWVFASFSNHVVICKFRSNTKIDTIFKLYKNKCLILTILISNWFHLRTGPKILKFYPSGKLFKLYIHFRPQVTTYSSCGGALPGFVSLFVFVQYGCLVTLVTSDSEVARSS